MYTRLYTAVCVFLLLTRRRGRPLPNLGLKNKRKNRGCFVNQSSRGPVLPARVGHQGTPSVQARVRAQAFTCANHRGLGSWGVGVKVIAKGIHPPKKKDTSVPGRVAKNAKCILYIDTANVVQKDPSVPGRVANNAKCILYD